MTTLAALRRQVSWAHFQPLPSFTPERAAAISYDASSLSARQRAGDIRDWPTLYHTALPAMRHAPRAIERRT